ncbi:hydroxyisourate hydrolase [Aquibacillus rhizosphaerae]|uniref:5-hydroxyisourate hydrolase n=1 Tax=Aquibacillus rhizosphaerae TaxID=3051431 RepID=A0ABT7L581_9BACI|nr:hydroxyisourate hydrolase [Aquibacillus sp. LR5S19]MDL4841020.1 hydroxyisourate hydrolase [Aquibacillus sp. LR5S19]
MAGLTTHILDLTHGQPASNVKVDLYLVISESNRQYVKSAITNADGRLDQAFLKSEEMEMAQYEIVFHIGDYYNRMDLNLNEPVFLNRVPVQFGISDVEAHYHVPLLVSPWGYQVYRGS